MASVVDIYNRVAQKLGAKRITSVDENSNLAQEINQCYSGLRDAALEEHRWSFAIERASLAADSPVPEWGKDNAFTWPSDCLKIIPPYPEDDDIGRDWVIEGRKIITDYAAPLYVRYIKQITDPNEMSPLFREYLATLIAFELCEKVTQSNTKKAGLKEDMSDIVNKAKKSSAIQSVAAYSPDDTWLALRN